MFWISQDPQVSCHRKHALTLFRNNIFGGELVAASRRGSYSGSAQLQGIFSQSLLCTTKQTKKVSTCVVITATLLTHPCHTMSFRTCCEYGRFSGICTVRPELARSKGRALRKRSAKQSPLLLLRRPRGPGRFHGHDAILAFRHAEITTTDLLKVTCCRMGLSLSLTDPILATGHSQQDQVAAGSMRECVPARKLCPRPNIESPGL